MWTILSQIESIGAGRDHKSTGLSYGTLQKQIWLLYSEAPEEAADDNKATQNPPHQFLLAFGLFMSNDRFSTASKKHDIFFARYPSKFFKETVTVGEIQTFHLIFFSGKICPFISVLKFRLISNERYEKCTFYAYGRNEFLDVPC